MTTVSKSLTSQILQTLYGCSAETDGSNGFTELDGAHAVDTFVIGSNTYAIVTALTDDGVQIINISDPTNIVQL